MLDRFNTIPSQAEEKIAEAFRTGNLETFLGMLGQANRKVSTPINPTRNKYTERMQDLVNKLINNESVTFEIADDKLIATYPDGSQHDITKSLKYANFCQISFSDEQLGVYRDHIKKHTLEKPKIYFRPEPPGNQIQKKEDLENLLRSFKENAPDSPLHDAQKLALNIYSTEEFYKPANHLLRGSIKELKKNIEQGATEEDQQNKIKELILGISMASSSYDKLPKVDINTFRGEDSLPQEILKQRLKAIKDGCVTREAGFSSTAHGKPNEMFYHGKNASVGVLYSGFKGVDMGAFSCKNEREYLLLPGQFVKWDVIKTENTPYLFIARPVTNEDGIKGLSNKIFRDLQFDARPVANLSFEKLKQTISSFLHPHPKENLKCRSIQEMAEKISEKLQSISNHYAGKDESIIRQIVSKGILTVMDKLNESPLSVKKILDAFDELHKIDKLVEKQRGFLHQNFSREGFWEKKTHEIFQIILENKKLILDEGRKEKKENPERNIEENVQVQNQHPS